MIHKIVFDEDLDIDAVTDKYLCGGGVGGGGWGKGTIDDKLAYVR